MEIEVVFRTIRWQCEQGHPRSHVVVGTNSLGELTAQWRCHQCNANILARIPLKDVINDIPPMPNQPLHPPLKGPLFTPVDMAELAGMHISDPDELC